MTEKIISYLAIFIAILIVMPAHEFAHAFVAYKCGDETAKSQGRLTLNPFAHFDVVGLVMLIFARFGWARPVPINPYNFKHLKRDYFFVSIAGVIMNYVIAFLLYPLMILVAYWVQTTSFESSFVYLSVNLLQYTLIYSVSISLNLFVFNLIPVYPLDGFRILEVICSKNPNNKFLRFVRRYGSITLLVLIVINWLSEYVTQLGYIDLFGFLMNFCTGLIRKPISLFWQWIFGLF